MLYKAPDAPSIYNACHTLFSKCKKAIGALPPTEDALELHVASSEDMVTV